VVSNAYSGTLSFLTRPHIISLKPALLPSLTAHHVPTTQYGQFFEDTLILSLKTPEHLKVMIFRASSINGSPVAGFRPLRRPLFCTQNLPNPDTRTSSPDAKVDLMISMRVWTISMDCFLVKPFPSAISSTMSAFVRVMWRSALKWLKVNYRQMTSFNEIVKCNNGLKASMHTP
jgi:hypothetical protein